jgi:hypothetical protein
MSIRIEEYLWAGYFQPEPGQFGCVNCDSLGDAYQELSNQTSCRVCPPNTQRYLGVLDGANRSSCQCKEGLHRAPFTASLPSPYTTTSLHRSPRHYLAGYYNSKGKAGEVRRLLPADMHRVHSSLRSFEMPESRQDAPSLDMLFRCRYVLCARRVHIVLASFVAHHLSKVRDIAVH